MQSQRLMMINVKNMQKERERFVKQHKVNAWSLFFLFARNVPSRPIFKSPSSVFIVSIDVVAVVAC